MLTATAGLGSAARSIQAKTDRGRQAFRGSAALGNQPAIDELISVWEECREPDWDGHGALPVSQKSLDDAYRVLDSLPLGLPLPSVGADPDGQVTLEWRTSSRRTLSVSVDPAGYL